MDLLDMDKAVRRVRKALERREHICVFGDYDVDGITATCLLTDFLRKRGAHVTSYIPARLEEGYGLNEIAVRALRAQDVKLIITVDCGITANQEAALCKELGMELVITDHHECKSDLPEAVAVVDPHRRTSRSRFWRWQAWAWRSSLPPRSRAIRRRCSQNTVTCCASARWQM